MKKKLPRINRINNYIDKYYDEFRNYAEKNSDTDQYIKSSKKNLKFTNSFLFKNRDLKIQVINNNNIPIFGSSIFVYLNSTNYRLWDLLYSILNLYDESIYLTSLIIQRMCYENIAHSRYFIDLLKKSMINHKEQDYSDLISKFIYSQEIIDDNIQSDVSDFNKLKKLPHINDSLRYYKTIKNKLVSYDSETYRKEVDNAYKVLSQISHPNSKGNTYFYSVPHESFKDDNFIYKPSSKKEYSPYRSYKFSHRNKRTKTEYFYLTEIIFKELVSHCAYLKNFKKEFSFLNYNFYKYLKTKTDNVTNYIFKLRVNSSRKYGFEPEETIH
mgnify:CR=1 FL=1|tara:strand:- start:280 stop:1260 length:981 start_codon:yes stop_codon:yes gene_type:complete